MATYKVWYRTKPNFAFDPPKTWKEADYSFMGELDALNEESLFALLNDQGDRPNPLGALPMQIFIRENHLHTSMSIGDIVEDGGKSLICASLGFEPILKEAA